MISPRSSYGYFDIYGMELSLARNRNFSLQRLQAANAFHLKSREAALEAEVARAQRVAARGPVTNGAIWDRNGQNHKRILVNMMRIHDMFAVFLLILRGGFF